MTVMVGSDWHKRHSRPRVSKKKSTVIVQPGVGGLGKALETVLGLGNTILWPIALVNERSRIY